MRRKRGASGYVAPIGPKVREIAAADLAVPLFSPSARVDAMLANAGLPPGSLWGGAAVSLWVSEACDRNGWTNPPVSGGDPSQMILDLQNHGRWRSPSELSNAQILPGRLIGRTLNGVTYIGVVNQVVNGIINIIEGAATDQHNRVAIRYTWLSDPRFLGIGIV